jgi:hypothetical protein
MMMVGHFASKVMCRGYLVTVSVSWYDHSRDLLNLVNHFRDEMIQPIVAIGHSMGVSQLYEPHHL